MHKALRELSELMKIMRKLKDARVAWRVQALENESFYDERTKMDICRMMEDDLQMMYDQLGAIVAQIVEALQPPGLRDSESCD